MIDPRNSWERFRALCRDLARSRIWWTGTGLLAAYWIVAAYLPAVYLIPLLNFVLIGIALAVTISYAPSVLDAVGGGFVLFVSLIVWQFGSQALRTP